MSSYTFILIHSPLVGPYTWRPVANVLQARGHTAIVPKLLDNPHATNPYWQQEVASVIDQLDVQTLQAPVILVAHSGAGVLLPAIRHAINHPISLCIFVDAGRLCRKKLHGWIESKVRLKNNQGQDGRDY